MKRILQIFIALVFGILFFATPTVIAQEPPEAICVFDEQEPGQEEQPVCDDTPEVTDAVILPEEPIKGEVSQETVAGTDEVLASEPAVLGVSTEATLAETGVSSELTSLTGLAVVVAVVFLFKSAKTYKLK